MKLWLLAVVGAGVLGWALLTRYDAWALVLAAGMAAPGPGRAHRRRGADQAHRRASGRNAADDLQAVGGLMAAVSAMDVLAEYARKVETGEVIPPLDFSDRCAALRVKGLDERIVGLVWEGGSADMLRQVEALTPDQVIALNEAART